MVSKNTICLWYNGTALDAAKFYAETFPDSALGAVLRAPGDYPAGKQGDVLTVEFTVLGIPCLGLNGGPEFKHSEAFSFQVATDDQAYWEFIQASLHQSDTSWTSRRQTQDERIFEPILRTMYEQKFATLGRVLNYLELKK